MPIRFRCTHCNRLLGIATRKAGTQTTCPHCGYQITVPTPGAEEPRTERMNMDDVDELLGKSASATAGDSAVAAPPAPPPVQPAVLQSGQSHGDGDPSELLPVVKKPAKHRPAPPPLPKSPAPAGKVEDRPLFEKDVDEILGATAPPEEPERPKRPATSGVDALSLSEPTRQVVLSPQRATLLFALVVVLMAISFAAGYFLAPRG